MKKIKLIFLTISTFVSCQKNNIIDIEVLNFNQGIEKLKNLVSFQKEDAEIVTYLPMLYTNDVEKFCFSEVLFEKNSNQDFLPSKVGFLTNNNGKTIEGVLISIEKTKKSNDFFKFLNSKYKNLIILSPKPKLNNKGILLGNSAFMWNLGNKSIFLTQSYEYTNGKKTVTSLIYYISNNTIAPNINQNIKERLIKTFKS